LVQKQCFPKDVKALTYMAEEAGAHPQLLNSVTEINDFQRKRVADKLHQLLGDVNGKTVALWGLAFKENTDDIRESPALDIARHLLRRGAVVRAYDPVAMPNSAEELPELVMCTDLYDAVTGADAVVVATPWNEFKQVDLDRVRGLMAQHYMVDGRNIYDPERMKSLGFTYRGVGRGYNGDGV
jgi:UDPglucose 6-dehydrogenase